MTDRARASSLEWVRIGEMSVSPKAQREFRPAHAEMIAADFQLEGLGYPVVSHRDGHYWILDGQHRIAALKLNGFTDEDKIECECYQELTEAEEAELFLVRDRRRAINRFDKFRIAIAAGRAAETSIERVVHGLDLAISKSPRPGAVSAVAALEFAFDLGGPAGLKRCLMLLRDSFDSDRAAFTPTLIKGAALVCQRYDGTLNDEDAVARLRKLPGPSALARRAVALQLKTGHQQHDCAAAAIVDALNSGRGGSKLESWWR